MSNIDTVVGSVASIARGKPAAPDGSEPSSKSAVRDL
jgi:hypothetical protein